MKTIIMDGEVFTKKAPFVDAFGEAMEAGKKAGDVKGDIRKFLSVGNFIKEKPKAHSVGSLRNT